MPNVLPSLKMRDRFENSAGLEKPKVYLFHQMLEISPGSNHKENFSINLCYAYFEHPDWFFQFMVCGQ